MTNNGLDFSALLNQIPVGDIATKLGVDQGTAMDAVSKALPGLLGGLAANAQTESGANSLEDALQQHRREVPGLNDVDVEDGKKIVRHALGSKEDAVVAQVGGNQKDLVSSLLPMLAPIVMAFLAKNLGNSRTSGGGGGIGDLLGSILGGGTGSAKGGGGLGGILGSILGGR